MKLPELNLFSDKSARIFLIFPSICPNFHGFPNWGGGQLPPPAPLSRTPIYARSSYWYWLYSQIINMMHNVQYDCI
jgi:hypothetical protein